MRIEKIDTEKELDWKVDDAIRAFTEYKKLTEDKKVKEKMIAELKKRSEEFKELSKEL
jgi:hypothetical protein